MKLEKITNLMIHNAIIFATEMHKKQFRKGTNIPYIVHPMEVMYILVENKCSQNVIVAGILHDVLEDTEATPEDVRKLFGPNVLSLVMSETQDVSKPWKERRCEALAKIHQDSIEAQQVCCADKLSNITSIYTDKQMVGDAVFQRFNASIEDIRWYYKSMVETLDKIDGYKMKEDLKYFVNKVFE